jgi:aromatic-L-amino-acid decarboxylase
MDHNEDRSMPEYPLELSGQAFAKFVEEATGRLSEFLDSLPEQRTDRSQQSAELARTISEPLPQTGQSFTALLETLFRDVFPTAFNTTSPGYLAYIPGGGLPHAALADLISQITNRYVGLWAAAPVAVQIEATVIRWLCEIVGFESGSGGFLTSGGSLANWAALVIAREKHLPEQFHSGAIYTSNQAHHSVNRAALLAGFPRGNLRLIQVDDQYRIRMDDLRRQVDDDRGQGKVPLAVVAHAGTTNTGAIDDLASLAEYCKQEQIWLHVDAAYGGFFLLTDRGRALMHGAAQADSMTLDPHKGLFLPYGTGCLLVRDQSLLQRTFAFRGEYMTAKAEQEFVDFCDISPELTREFRGLRLWLPLKMHGIGPFRQALDEKLDLAQYAAAELRKIKDIEIVAEPQLSLLAFRYSPAGQTTEETNELNRKLLDRINSVGRVFLSPTMLDDKFVIRLCILSVRTHRDRNDEFLEIVRQCI